MEDFEKCIVYSKRAIKINDEAYYAKFNIALATLRKGKITKANELYKQYYSDSINDIDKIEAAISDLKDLIEKNIMVEESKFIIENILN
jgi:tetratricopeptide (TPR) repeat protein